MKLAICTPTRDTVHADFAFSLASLVGDLVSQGVTVALINANGADIAKQRCEGVLFAKKHLADKLLFIDSDMKFPPYMARRLLEAKGPIVGPAVCRRAMPFRMNTEPELRLDGTTTEYMEVNRLGTGIMLIDMAVFAKLPMPWFQSEYQGEKAGAHTWRSEDEFFCDRARMAGFTITVDVALTAQIAHIGSYPYTILDAVATQQVANA